VSRHARRAAQSRPFDNAGHVGRCPDPDCGKLMFVSRQQAKRAARQAQSSGIAVTRVYACGRYWHWTSQGTGQVTANRDYWRAS
jgi:hypothetical protein